MSKMEREEDVWRDVIRMTGKEGEGERCKEEEEEKQR